MWRRIYHARAPVRETLRPTGRTVICLPARAPLRSVTPWPPLAWTGRLALIGEDLSIRSSRRTVDSVAFPADDSIAVSVGFAAALGSVASGRDGIEAVGTSSCSLISCPRPRISRSYAATSVIYGLTKTQPYFVGTCTSKCR